MAEENVRVWNFIDLNNFRQFSPVVKNHLKRVYITLICALVVSAFGVYIHMLFNIGGLFTSLGVILSMNWLHKTHTNQQSCTQAALRSVSIYLSKVSIGPLIKLAIDLDSSIIITAFVGTSVLFACFSAAAILARRREFLHLRGGLTSTLYTLGPLQFASMINSAYFLEFELQFGLLVFMGYMVVDTQNMVEKAHRGFRDYVEHSFTCFTDFVAVFVRILIILMLLNFAHEVEKHRMALVAHTLCQITKTAIHEILVARARRDA